jgi:5-formyltetrahydrofolate cyclo-ligase
MNPNSELRKQMRRRRCELDARQRQIAEQQLTRHLINHRWFKYSRHIAFYLPNNGEVSLWDAIEQAWKLQKQCYLPVLSHRHSGRLWFVPFDPDSALVPNRFGIPEPLHRRRDRLFKPRQLDLVLTPLVAYDHAGYRLGMGGGFYDRTFAFRHPRRGQWHKPRLLGAAYAFQACEQLEIQPWDVRIDGVVTDQGTEIWQE